jgi:hypothetical protein
MNILPYVPAGLVCILKTLPFKEKKNKKRDKVKIVASFPNRNIGTQLCLIHLDLPYPPDSEYIRCVA